jgi:hypothetical protein
VEGKLMVAQQAVYYARPEVLQNKVPKTFKFTPVADYWYLKSGAHTSFCPESGHDPNCIRFEMQWFYVPVCYGYWYLKTPIDVKSQMPGSGHTLIFAQFDSMIRVGWGTWILQNSRGFQVLNADTRDVLWEVWDEKIMQGDNTWTTNKYPLKVDVSTVAKIDVGLIGVLRCLTGAFNTHFANMFVTFEYVPTTPPEPATVHIYVYDRQTSKPIGGALVQLLSGQKVIAQGYTGGDGWVTFNNVPAGVEGVSYTLDIMKSGYVEYTDSIDVVPAENSFKFALTPVPSPPIPWEWIIAGAAVVVIGGVAIAATRRKGPEVVVVSK